MSTQQLQDYPTIDIMNSYPRDSDGSRGQSVQYKEFQIMLQTTFRKLTQQGDEQKAAAQKKKDGKKKSGGAMLTGHPQSLRPASRRWTSSATPTSSVCATKMWSYYYHREFIMEYPIEPIGEAVAETGGRIVGHRELRAPSALRRECGGGRARA